jgi:hypothetical protein
MVAQRVDHEPRRRPAFSARTMSARGDVTIFAEWIGRNRHGL